MEWIKRRKKNDGNEKVEEGRIKMKVKCQRMKIKKEKRGKFAER